MDHDAEPLEGFLDDRLIFVTGKGGTGKTTYAAAIARVQAAAGRRTLLCEVDNQRPALQAIFGVDAGLDPETVTERLDVANVVWPDALVAYLSSMIGAKRIVKAILANDRIRSFLDFTPGSQELVFVSVIVDLLDDYDCVVVDMPASGHAYSMLDITRSALGLFRAGPVRKRVEQLREVITTPTTRTVFVALPEEMVVNETLETVGRMDEGGLLGAPPVVMLNRAIPPSYTAAEVTLLQRLSDEDLPPAAEEFVAAGRWELSLETAAERAITRLTEAFGRPPVVIPPTGRADAAAKVAARVARQLGRTLGIARGELQWPTAST